LKIKDFTLHTHPVSPKNLVKEKFLDVLNLIRMASGWRDKGSYSVNGR
jgi:hypothetical protein